LQLKVEPNEQVWSADRNRVSQCHTVVFFYYIFQTLKLNIFTAFQSRNFRLFFFGQSVSLIGTWMQRTAVLWLLYTATDSALILGLAVFCGLFPSFVFSILGGVVSDRYNRYRILLITQILSLTQALILTLLVSSGSYEVWQILFLSVVLGTINAFDVPARQAMIYDMVNNKEYLPNAIALNSSMVNIARLAGPAIAGIILKKFGSEACFLLNSMSFVAVISSLLLMKLPAYVPKKRRASVVADLKEGFGYLRNTPEISKVMLMLAGISLVALPYVTLLPIYAKEIFVGDATIFGLLNSFVGLGAVCGALFLASLNPGSNLKKVLLRCTLIFGSGLIAFSFTEQLPLGLAFLTAAGFGMMSQTTISNTLIQTTVAPAMRGRVISYYAMAFFGMQPIGGLLIGTLAHYAGAPATILVQGIITILIALFFIPFLRPEFLVRKQKMKFDQLEEQAVETT
jgi:MFS family permease